LGAPKTYDSAEKLLKDPEVDAVDICVPGGYHAAIAISAAENGKHILLEKPMATSVRDCDAIISAARRAGVTLMMAHSLRFFPPLVKCKEIVDSGGVGDMIKMRATLTAHFPYMDWRLDPAIAGGGVLTEYGVHPIYLTDWFIGPIARVTAFTRNSQEDLKTEDAAYAILGAKGGAHGIIDVNLGGPLPLWDDHIEFVGTRGLLTLNGIEMQILRGPPLLHYRDDGIWQVYREKTFQWPGAPDLPNEIDWKYTDCFVAEIREFTSSVLEERPPLVTGEDGRRSIQILYACYESARSGKVVEIV
jgi:UDP-N-acetylglucosamine 3-dehydrogenase